MAANLVAIMQNALTGLFPNHSINASTRDSVYNAITWGGLNETDVWHTKNDTMFIRAMNTMARDTSTHAPFSMAINPGTIYTYDSHNLNMIKGCH